MLFYTFKKKLIWSLKKVSHKLHTYIYALYFSELKSNRSARDRYINLVYCEIERM